MSVVLLVCGTDVVYIASNYFTDILCAQGKLNPWTHDPKKVFTKVYTSDAPWYLSLNEEIIGNTYNLHISLPLFVLLTGMF